MEFRCRDAARQQNLPLEPQVTDRLFEPLPERPVANQHPAPLGDNAWVGAKRRQGVRQHVVALVGFDAAHAEEHTCAGRQE